jgi:hypothetical protein
MKRGMRTPSWLGLSLSGGRAAWTCALVSACLACTTTSTRQGMRIQAAEDWHCPKGSIRVTNEGASSFRVSGCGQSALYVCEDEAPRTPSAAPPQASMAEEEEYRVQGGSCYKASHD